MKIVTANRLEDGAVVYLGDDDRWTESLADAAQFDDQDAENVLAAAESRVEEIAGAYLAPVDEDGAVSARERLRETIRSAGPTVRLDLGRQSECCA